MILRAAIVVIVNAESPLAAKTHDAVGEWIAILDQLPRMWLEIRRSEIPIKALDKCAHVKAIVMRSGNFKKPLGLLFPR
ncbi:hypothetical protein CUJ84_pRLN1000402 (plasmid) [Rhizobium leguminosarum]|uniref:Uncharacterized protein n=1 Tax=Rhizobium leguminosarum TaxID=384 RepID=A0A2K9ZCC4_RHILE|nr:hypothetical protein CUJ84_pRLN1000402 [Rhizobium leguminosarum]